jgi:hypothetical protein
MVQRIAAMLLVLVAAGCGGSSGGGDVEEISVSGYPLVAKTFDDAVAFTGNDHVVLGTVRAVGAPRWNTKDGAKPADFGAARSGPDPVTFIYTPVEVVVDDAFGDAELSAAKAITVRSLGGTRDNVRYTFDEVAPAVEYRPGQRVVLFLQERIDGAYTPNFVGFVDGGGTARLFGNEAEAALEDVVASITR